MILYWIPVLGVVLVAVSALSVSGGHGALAIVGVATLVIAALRAGWLALCTYWDPINQRRRSYFD